MISKDMEHNHYLRPWQAASFLNVHPRTIRRWAQLRQIRFFITPGGEHRIPASEVERILGRPLEHCPLCEERDDSANLPG